jgi:transposase-like protein
MVGTVYQRCAPGWKRLGLHQTQIHSQILRFPQKLAAWTPQNSCIPPRVAKVRLVRQVFQSAVDLRPDPQNQTLTIRLHRLSTAAHDEALSHLCEELTATETVYPGTDLKMIYEAVGGKTAEAEDGPQPDPPS